jgi:hypothetical protein
MMKKIPTSIKLSNLKYVVLSYFRQNICWGPKLSNFKIFCKMVKIGAPKLQLKLTIINHVKVHIFVNISAYYVYIILKINIFY